VVCICAQNRDVEVLGAVGIVGGMVTCLKKSETCVFVWLADACVFVWFTDVCVFVLLNVSDVCVFVMLKTSDVCLCCCACFFF